MYTCTEQEYESIGKRCVSEAYFEGLGLLFFFSHLRINFLSLWQPYGRLAGTTDNPGG